MNNLHIREMIRRDMAEVLDIETDSFQYPWSKDDFIRRLRQRHCIGMVADWVADGPFYPGVVGFMIYELHKSRLRVLNFAVRRAHRRRGVGSRMIGKLIDKLSARRRTKLVLEVRETNLPAQLFFRACGFRAVSVLRGHYDDTDEAAYVMEYRYKAAFEDVVGRIAK